MTAAAPSAHPTLRSALVCAAPAMILAALLLAPFLNNPFTIDDPLYMREAQHTLIDPLHPQAFNMVWSLDLNLRASTILPGGIAVPYLLIPAVLAGSTEWAAHLTQLVMLLGALYATTLAGLRLGMDRRQAGLTALLTGACPAVLGIAGTVMPDIPAMLFVILGMERMLAWRDERKWHQAVAATFWLTLAALTRIQTILILAPAFVLLLDGITVEGIRASFTRFPARFLPLVLTPILYFAVSALITDPESDGENILAMASEMIIGLHLIAQNACAFLAHWLLVIPLTAPWLVLRYKQLSKALVLAPLVAASLASVKLGWAAFAAAATFIVLADILWDAVERRDRVQLALWSWLIIAAPVVFYIHLPSKYLLPSVPAAAMLVALRVRESTPAIMRWLVPSTLVASVALGVLILLGVRDLAETQRRAVAELIVPEMSIRHRVWFAGHWGFQWYAEKAGAVPVTVQPPMPEPGDSIVVSQIDFPFFVRKWTHPKVLRHVCYPSSKWGRVMDFDARAGFFSSPFGYLPWVWGSGDASCFDVWDVE